MWNTFVVSRLLYGLEVLHLTKKDIQSLEDYQMKVMKQIQHLPSRTSNAISLVLLGQLPIEAIIHKRILTVFGDSVRSESTERDVVMRQLAMKSIPSNSWVNTARQILQKLLFTITSSTLRNPAFKTTLEDTMVKDSVANYWTRELCQKVRTQ
jgi:hypothetical protein